MSTILHTRDRFQGLAGLPIPTASMWGWWSAEEAYTDAGKTTRCSASGSDTCYTLGDLSGNGRDMVQATAGNRPTWYSSRANNLPSLKFDGSNDNLKITTGTKTTFVWYAVFRQNTWSSSARPFGRGNDATDIWIDQNDTTPSLRVGNVSAFNNGTGNVGGFMLFAVNWQDSSNGYSIINAGPAASGGASMVGSCDGWCIGSRVDATFAANIDFCEGIIYNTNHAYNSGDGLAVRRYLAKKYNLGFSL